MSGKSRRGGRPRSVVRLPRPIREYLALRGIPRITDAEMHRLADEGARALERQARMWESVKRALQRRGRPRSEP